MKSKEELNTIKAEAEALKNKLVELSDDELQQVTGGNTLEEDDDGYSWSGFKNLIAKLFGIEVGSKEAEKKQHPEFF